MLLDRTPQKRIYSPESGGDLASLMGRDPDQVLQLHSYVTRDMKQPIPDPVGDQYLNTQAAFYANQVDQIAVSFSLIPGLEQYLREQGILKGILIQLSMRERLAKAVDKVLPFEEFSGEEVGHYLGYPNGSVEVALLKRLESDQGLLKQLRGRVPYGTFENTDLAELRIKITGENDFAPDVSYRANNKAELRKASEAYRVNMPDGFIASDKATLIEGIAALRRRYEGKAKIWTKVGTGSGGDLVLPIEGSDDGSQAFEKLTAAVANARKYCKSPEPDFQPTFIGEVHIEDLPGVEKVLANINAQGVVSQTDEIVPVKAIGYSRQRTSENGEYLGNLFGHDEELEQAEDLILEALSKVGLWLKSIGYEGIFGIDIILVQQNGKKAAYVIDCNARPNASTSSLLLRNYFYAPYSLNCNLILPKPIVTFEQVIELLGRENLFNSNLVRGVLPKMFRAVPGEFSHPLVKCDIIGDTLDMINKVRDQLVSRDIKIK